ncbi:hypothetical protein JO972_15955 [Verrucomicrobiaceae bacterium 5K15]|uniref:Uncharacterized protein n=1 Tax=Oceaniferula flava TaxID=2800421 RepID=A0AAE2SEL8_9BACT|nr:hypothetical protein [Oceaniferula flavus]MBK1856463.1 hypothetical protein [Oceaniferula flavus]MBM1137770.1 hypothetical protein [Oceaniferula flavus]
MIRIYTLYVALLLCVTLESARASGPDAWSVDSFHYRFSSLEDENIEIRFIFQSKAGENLVGDVRHPQWGRALKEVQIKSKKFELTIPEEEARCIFVGEIESVNLFFEGRKKNWLCAECWEKKENWDGSRGYGILLL